MVWWPFGSKNETGDLGLAPDSEKHYKDVLSSINNSETTADSKSEQSAPKTEQTTVSSFIPDSQGRRVKPLKQIAMDNCVEFENAYSKCLVNGSYFERIASCQPQQTMYEQCKSMQMEALEMLGYASAADNDHRKAIKILADDLMIKAVPTLKITDSQAEEFHRLVEQAAKR